ncbi:biotin--[acetyl-CoA-carboxylase] ligase [Reichenbachiella sp. MALMAid0571]|uniref:biotin--[acetyl-CoA-carboxylase] ligase n=1 Tax=Reichenbachiella sp. MALMAid0571 TaxID=3143939 RepID=UPI0032E0424D
MHKFFAKTQFLGKKVYSLPQCHSTNEEAQRLISEKKTIEGQVVITANQTKGKGQRGNAWESEPNLNLTFSIILKPTFLKIANQFELHKISSLAIHDALFPILGNKLKIKWPNDIYYGDLKLAGILIENILRGNSIEYSIVGIGLNINQLIFKNDFATSLADITMEEHNTYEIAESILVMLEKRYLELKNGNSYQLLHEYHSRLYKFEQPQLFKISDSVFTGRIKGVNETGKLLIEENEQLMMFDFKEVEFLRE